MSNQIVISSGAKVRELEGVLTGTSGVVNSLAINVPNGIPQLDGSGKILVSQLPNSVMEYKGSWNAATNTPTLVNGTGNAGDVYLCEVAGTVNFGAGPIAFFVGDQVVYSGTIWQRASGSTGTVTSVSVTESGDALTITGSPITTSGTINIGFTGTSGQYVNGAGGLTTFPTDNITGSGASGQVTYFNGTNTITGENAFNYDASTNRLGVNTTVPNATIGANAGIDSGYSLLLKNDNANYNGIGFATDSTYGNLIATEKLGTATTRNLTLLNQSGYISLTEAGNLGVGILNPNTGIDIYNGTTSSLWLHTANSGITGTDGVRLALFSNNGANLRNFEGAMSITSEGDFSVITLGAENLRVNSVDGSIYQSKVANALLKSVSGVITAAVAGTDYVAPASLSAYVPYTGATTNVNLGTHSLSAYDLIINHTSGSGVAASITKGGNGEALTVVKTSGSGNAASITGGVTLLSELHLTTSLADAYIASAATWNAKMSGSGTSGQVAYFNGSNSITSEAGFIYDASTNRLGVNTSVPNATIGADAGLDSGYGLLIKTGSANYNGIGIAVDSTYGNLISTEKLGTASARNLTLLNQSGFVSLRENGNFGVNTLNPSVSGTGIDVYSSTSTGIRFHTATSGTTVNDGAGINFSAGNNLGITNYEAGTIDIVTNGNSGVFIDSSGNVGIKGATPTTALTVNGGAAISALTTGQIVFPTSGGTLAGSSNLFWDNTNGKLGVGTSTLSGAIVTISSSTEANHLQLVSNAPAMTFINAISYSYYATVGMATANNNFITGAVQGDLVLGAYNTSSILFYNNNTNTMRMSLNGSGAAIFSGSVTARGPKSQIVVDGNSVGAAISLNNSIVGVNRRNWLIGTEENVEGDFVIKRSTVSGGTATSTVLSLSRDGAATLTGALSGTSATFSGNMGVGGTTTEIGGFTSLTISNSSNGSFLDLNNNGTNNLRFLSLSSVDQRIQAQGNLRFDTGGTPRLTIASTGAATFSSSVTSAALTIGSLGSGSNAVLTLATNASGSPRTIYYKASDATINITGTGGTDLMTITNGGNVGIGTSSPGNFSGVGFTGPFLDVAGVLQVKGTSANGVAIIQLGGDTYRKATIETSIGTQDPYIAFGTSSSGSSSSGTERMRITSSGNVGIGTSSPLQTAANRVVTTINGTNSAILNLAYSGTLAGYLYADNSNYTELYSVGQLALLSNASQPMTFSTNGSERMRIDSLGQCLFNVSTGYGAETIQLTSRISGGTQYGIIIQGNAVSYGQYAMRFVNQGVAVVGSITFTTTATAYNTSSDYRLKEDFKDFNALDIMSKIKFYDFKWKAEDSRMVGVKAHELKEIVPYAVNGEKDAIDEKGNPTYQGVDYSKLVAIQGKAIQELHRQIEELKALINK